MTFWKDGFGKSIILALIFLGSFFSAWTVFVLVVAGWSVCWKYIGQTDSYLDYIGGW